MRRVKGNQNHHRELTATLLIANAHLTRGSSPLGSHTPEPSTPTLADMESSPPPPAHLSPRKRHTREQVITTSRSTRSAAQRENTARQKELEEV